MASKYRHGGGYKQAALEEGINWKLITDYSTSINWKAAEYYPEHLIYLHQENIEYPNPEYPDLKELIKDVYNIPDEYFLITHGANEAISTLFYMFTIQGYNKNKTIALIGPTYSEYNKYSDLNGFNSIQVDFDDFNSRLQDFTDKIVIIVNPNTPFGFYFDIKPQIEFLLNSGAIVIIDESFIDFTEKHSMLDLLNDNSNLFIIHSLTKFYGSPGARLGLLISSNDLLKNCLAKLLPHWTISAYDKWFYKTMLIQYNKIKKDTLSWVKEADNSMENILKNSKNIKKFSGSVTSYHTLEVKQEFLEENGIQDLQKYFLKIHNIYVRPTADFYGCSKTSFRVGLRIHEENEPLLKALKDIG